VLLNFFSLYLFLLPMFSRTIKAIIFAQAYPRFDFSSRFASSPVYATTPLLAFLPQTAYTQLLTARFASLALAGVILALSLLLAVSQPDTEKSSAYECGFEPFEEARSRFDVRFYVVAILFLLFDLEVAFLFP